MTINCTIDEASNGKYVTFKNSNGDTLFRLDVRLPLTDFKNIPGITQTTLYGFLSYMATCLIGATPLSVTLKKPEFKDFTKNLGYHAVNTTVLVTHIKVDNYETFGVVVEDANKDSVPMLNLNLGSGAVTRVVFAGVDVSSDQDMIDFATTIVPILRKLVAAGSASA